MTLLRLDVNDASGAAPAAAAGAAAVAAAATTSAEAGADAFVLPMIVGSISQLLDVTASAHGKSVK
jgi:hypothetical protein